MDYNSQVIKSSLDQDLEDVMKILERGKDLNCYRDYLTEVVKKLNYLLILEG
ncbi:MAG: hypothetical protein AB7W16_18595 [Candidatus Obscuribacterales bacterium]